MLSLIQFLLHSSLALTPTFEGPDLKRDKIRISLTPVFKTESQITDIVDFGAADKNRVLVLTKPGKLISINMSNKSEVLVRAFSVQTRSELGLLGAALDPDFKSNRRIYFNYNPSDGAMRTRISRLEFNSDYSKLENEEVLLEIEQPYANHNGGQIRFGPDRMLYIGMGDGGSAGDPLKAGQDPKNLLGKILRIDVTKPSPTQKYSIPKDNPKLAGWRPEIYAIGLRNPWKFSFEKIHGLVVADVGQNREEEISIARSGGNLGWNTMEGDLCFDPKRGCAQSGLDMPVLVYGRDDGGSITGGYVYEGSAVPDLQGLYVFGDFVSGKIWAADLKMRSVKALGKYDLSPATFYRSRDGEVWVSDFGSGNVYQLSKP